MESERHLVVPEWCALATVHLGSTPNLIEMGTIGNPGGPTACVLADIPNNCVNIGGDFNLDGGTNDRPNSTASSVKRRKP